MTDNLSYSKGICWIDDCRIPFVDDKDVPNDMDKTHLQEDRLWNGVKGLKPFLYEQNTQGRFPANILVSDDVLNDGSVGKSGKKGIRTSNGFNENSYGKGIGVKKGQDNGEYGDKGTNSRYYDIDKWFDKLLDE